MTPETTVKEQGKEVEGQTSQGGSFPKSGQEVPLTNSPQPRKGRPEGRKNIKHNGKKLSLKAKRAIKYVGDGMSKSMAMSRAGYAPGVAKSGGYGIKNLQDRLEQAKAQFQAEFTAGIKKEIPTEVMVNRLKKTITKGKDFDSTHAIAATARIIMARSQETKQAIHVSGMFIVPSEKVKTDWERRYGGRDQEAEIVGAGEGAGKEAETAEPLVGGEAERGRGAGDRVPMATVEGRGAGDEGMGDTPPPTPLNQSHILSE